MTDMTNTEIAVAAERAFFDVAERLEAGKATKRAMTVALKAHKAAMELLGEGFDFPEVNGPEDAGVAAETWNSIAADVEMLSEDEDSPSRRMAKTLAAYKPGYVNTTSYSGSASQDNGDPVAEAMRGLEPAEVCRRAEKLLGMDAGSLVARYEALNPGQIRMNAGNLIRNAIKRGDLDPASLS